MLSGIGEEWRDVRAFEVNLNLKFPIASNVGQFYGEFYLFREVGRLRERPVGSVLNSL